jgi:hypothetical protein
VETDLGVGEDERSASLHIATMKQQWAMRSRDVATITDRMERTFVARRASIERGMRLDELLETYPALQDEKQVNGRNIPLSLGLGATLPAAGLQ